MFRLGAAYGDLRAAKGSTRRMEELEAARLVDRREKKAFNGLRRRGGAAQRARAKKDFGSWKDKSGQL